MCIVINTQCVIAQNTSFFLQKQTILDNDGYRPNVIMGQDHYFNDKFGMSFLQIINRNKATVYSGFAYKFNKHVSLKTFLGVIVNTQEFPLDGAAGVVVNKKKWINLSYLGYNNTGYWYFHTTTYEIHQHFKAGVHAQRFVGVGPRFDIPIGKFNLWNAGVYNIDTKNFGFVIGTILTFNNISKK